MSLDVYLYNATTHTCSKCGHADPMGSECVFTSNITHNLSRMAAAADIYTALWHPAELLAPEIAAQIRVQEQAGNYHEPGGVYELEKTLPTARAQDILPALRAGLTLLRGAPEHFRTFEPENKWGTYDGFIPWIESYLAACELYPTATIRVSR